MNLIPAEKKAEIFLKCIGHLSTQLRGHAGLESGAVSRANRALRDELLEIRRLGGKLPQVANLDHAEHGANEDFSTLTDLAEITFDTILAYGGTSRGCRYKSNEFSTALKRSFEQRNRDLSLEYTTLKATLDIRTRQLGCLLCAAGTMLLAPLELRTLLLSLLTEDLLEDQGHLYDHIQKQPKLLAEVLIDLGLTGRVLVEHFSGSLNQISLSEKEKRCERFEGIIESLGLNTPPFLRRWIRIKQSFMSKRLQSPRQYRDDGKGGWEEQVKADSNRNGWTTWITVPPSKPTITLVK
jgi:hypothetical protein